MTDYRFKQALSKLQVYDGPKDSIGTYQEKNLHRFMKHFLDSDLAHHEVRIGNYICDIFDGQIIIEIQIGNFNKLKEKLSYLLSLYPVRIVLPLPYCKWLSWMNPQTKELTPQRKSPKQGSIYQIMPELYKIKPFLKNTNLSFTIYLIDVLEIRLLDGWSKDKKNGSHRYNYYPLAIKEEYNINNIDDYYLLIPNNLPFEFNTLDFIKITKLSKRRGYEAISVLKSIDCLELSRKVKNSNYYKIKKRGKENGN